MVSLYLCVCFLMLGGGIMHMYLSTATKDGHWTEEEHQLFLRSWEKYGKSWKKLSEIMKTRSNEQIRTHAQKYFNKLRELRSVYSCE